MRDGIEIELRTSHYALWCERCGYATCEWAVVYLPREYEYAIVYTCVPCSLSPRLTGYASLDDYIPGVGAGEDTQSSWMLRRNNDVYDNSKLCNGGKKNK